MGAEEGMVVSRILEKKNSSLFNTNLQYLPNPPPPGAPFPRFFRFFLKTIAGIFKTGKLVVLALHNTEYQKDTCGQTNELKKDLW